MKNQARRYEYAEKWVTCLNCSYERVIEYAIPDDEQEGCPICGSHAYEESMSSRDDWGDF